MRLCYCYHCRTLSKIEGFLGRPEDDRLLQDWIDRHMHGLTEDQHPGGRIFPMEVPELASSPRRMLEAGIDDPADDPVFERKAVEHVKALLAQQQHEVLGELRDELKDDAAKCFNRHRRPEHPGKPCIDYNADHKRLGRRNQPPSDMAMLCTYCAYTSTVTVAKRIKRGDYN